MGNPDRPKIDLVLSSVPYIYEINLNPVNGVRYASGVAMKVSYECLDERDLMVNKNSKCYPGKVWLEDTAYKIKADMYLKWSIIISIFEGHRVVLVVPNSNTNVCCSSPLIVGLAMAVETGIRSNIQSFPLATPPRQNFSARNICCLLDSIVTAMTGESLGLSIRVHSSLSLECHRVAKKLMIDLLGGSQLAKIHYTSNHIICLDFVWIATQRPKIVWIDPN